MDKGESGGDVRAEKMKRSNYKVARYNAQCNVGLCQSLLFLPSFFRPTLSALASQMINAGKQQPSQFNWNNFVWLLVYAEGCWWSHQMLLTCPRLTSRCSEVEFLSNRPVASGRSCRVPTFFQIIECFRLLRISCRSQTGRVLEREGINSSWVPVTCLGRLLLHK